MTELVEFLEVEPLTWARDWPAWQVPPAALGEWVALQLALAVPGRQTPCQADPELWFTGVQQEHKIAAAVEGCRRCPVLEECATYGLAARERDGVWGGLSPAERRGGGRS